MSIVERGISFPCEGCWLYGVLSIPPASSPQPTRGVVLVVGGPQYRVGSHRQFTLLARELAQQGIPVLRFDYRGMGDSEGEIRDFLDVDADLRAAIDAFAAELPAIRDVVLWGLCDAASAAMLYSHQDPRVTGLVLLNPWARTEEGAARAYLKHYYLSRLTQPGLWRKIAKGQFDYAAAARSFLNLCANALRRRKPSVADSAPAPSVAQLPSLPERMLTGFARFQGRSLIIISGADLTGREFLDMAAAPAWRKEMRSKRVSRQTLPQADHTFSRPDWRDQVAQWTAEWLRRW
ncbi:MAG: hydrolase 1, exosortase system-associated [Burkholderia sp.]|nr:hydrolase 1, exosortase system-associated [Burkholderia sp.]